MRICMVCPSYPPQDLTCGVGDYTRCLTEELVRQGEQAVVVTSTGYCGNPDGTVRVLPLITRWSAVEGWKLLRSRLNPRPEVIHLQYTPDLYGQCAGFLLVPLLAKLSLCRIPVIVTFHTLIGGSLWSKLMAPWLLATADRSISANEEVSALITRHLPVLQHRATSIGIGSNVPVSPVERVNVRRTERQRLGISDESPLLVHFGMVYPGKGLETLFQALPAILRQVSSARLAIVGATRPESQSYRSELERLARERGIAHGVVWSGQCPAETVSRILAAADLFVVPYDDGGTIRRGSLMAGLAHGLPVVTTYSPVRSSYLRDGDNVALVPSKDPDALAKRICSLLASAEETARLRRGALALSQKFSWPIIAQETRALYARVLKQ